MRVALLLLGLTLLASSVAAIKQANYSDLLAKAAQTCQVEVKLYDTDGDGWTGNTFQLRAGPGSADYAVPLSPLTQLCITSNNANGNPTIGTLGDNGAYCAFRVEIPAGWYIEADFFYTVSTWPWENHVSLQLDYVQPFFGPVITASSKFHNVTDSKGNKFEAPYLDPVFGLICGPVPSQVSAVTASPNTGGTGAHSVETSISWTPIITANATVAYAVSVQDLTSGDDARSLGIITSTSLNVTLEGNTNYLISVKAINQYGESRPTTFSYLTPNYVTAQVDVILYATRPSAWSPDGRLVVSVNGAVSGVFTIADASSQVIFSVPYLANGQPQLISWSLAPPSGSVGDVTYRIVRHENGSELFNSGQTVHGPVYYDGTVQVTHAAPAKTCGVCCLGTGKCSSADPDGYCCDANTVCCKTGSTSIRPYTCCSGSQKCLTNYTSASQSQKTCAVPIATCPNVQPTAGASCYGVLSCSYNNTCCCPGDADEVCGPTVSYQCTGTSKAVWAASPLSLPCQSDSNFVCPSACPASQPTTDQKCAGAKTCLYGKYCCCPDEPDQANQVCTNQYQLKCAGTIGGYWQSTTVVPSCPSLCYSQTKAGVCPAANTTCYSGSNKVSTCQADTNCNGRQKCCDTGCGNACVTPCDCSSSPSCQPWEVVAFTAGSGCCGGTKSCVTDATSTACPTAAPDWSGLQCVVPTGKTCGAGQKTRTLSTRDSVKGCLTTTESQACSVPCAVDCVGSWSACGQCSSACRGGTCTRTFRITTQPSNGGKACNSSDGTTSVPEACPNLPNCPMYCPIRVVVNDKYGDGWCGSPLGSLSVYDNSTNALLLTQYINGPGRQDVKTNFTAMLVLSGTTLKLNYTKDKRPAEDMIQIVQNGNNVAGAILYQDPVDLKNYGTSGSPQTTGYYTVTCNDCSLVSPAYCLSVEHRQPCSMFGTGTGTGASGCGACAPGYTTGINTTGSCVDLNECANPSNLCAAAGAGCKNTDGSFSCICPKGTYWSFGYCETPGVCPPIRNRREFFDLSASERELIHKAYRCLYDTGLYNQLWVYHSAIPGGNNGVGYPSPFHYAHDHGSGFYYFHRAYGLRFEDLVRQCSIQKNITELRCFTMSYWDSPAMITLAPDNANRIQLVRDNFFTDATDSNGNHYGFGKRTDQYDPTFPFNYLAGPLPAFYARGPDSNQSTLWPASDAQVGAMASATTMQGLTGLIAPHFAHHPFIGGAAGGVESSRDPWFFSTHMYYDQLWEMWKVCKNVTSWSTAAPNQRWYANDPSKDYSPDGPIQGMGSVTPADVFDNMNILIRDPTTSQVVGKTAVVYSSSSYTRAAGASLISCPQILGKYFNNPITPDQVSVSALEMTIKSPKEFAQKIAFVEGGGKYLAKNRKAQIKVPPPHLWAHHPNPTVHQETYTEWRQHVRRLAGGSHNADDRHANVLSHTFSAPKSHLGKDIWLQTGTRDVPTQQDIGAQCRQFAKTLQENSTEAEANLYVLECVCRQTGASSGSLDPETIRKFDIHDLCQSGGCQISQCSQFISYVRGRDDADRDDRDDNDGSESDTNSGSNNSTSTPPPSDSSTDSGSNNSTSTPTPSDSPTAAIDLISRLKNRVQAK